MPRYVFDVRHLDDLCLEDNPGVELPDYAAAREFALKVMLGLVQSQDAGRFALEPRDLNVAAPDPCSRSYHPHR
jgi:hypothetical protein